MSMALFTNAAQSRSTATSRLKFENAKGATLRNLLLVLCLSIYSTAFGQGKVSGVVTDSAGLEVPHASVEALERGKGAGIVGSGPDPWIQADTHGRFRINLPPGRYKIVAKGDLDGYPDPLYLLSADSTAKFPEITVGSKDISGLRVVLGKRGGVLDGQVVDRESHSPLPGAKITIRDAQNAGGYVEVFADATGYFQFTVPGKPILISSSAAGYNPGNFARGAQLTLVGGEHRHIVIDLQHQ